VIGVPAVSAIALKRMVASTKVPLGEGDVGNLPAL
jgi:hypothetical protein